MKTSDNIEKVLDKLNDIREELLSIERSIERIFATERRNGSGKSRPRKLKIQP
jgi:predicted translin family RNA/ssDNA-binding protein